MKKNIKLLLFICVALLTFCTNVFNVNAKIIEQGSYINNPWYLNSEKTMYAYIWNKVLYIKGNGELLNERYYYLLYNDIASNKADFFYLDIGEGITRIPGDGYETPFSDFEIRGIHIPKSVKVIPDYVFCDVIGLDTDDSNYGIFYDGTEEEWEAVNKGIGNTSLENARISFNGSRKISDLEYDIYVDSKKKDDIRTIDQRRIGFPDFYIMPDPVLPVRYNSIIHNEDILDFGLTHYTGIINYYRTNDKSTKLGTQRSIGLDTKLKVDSTGIDSLVSGWKVFSTENSEINVYPVEYYKNVRILGSRVPVTIGEVIATGKVLDLKDNESKTGKVIYKAPKGESFDDIIITGETVELESLFKTKSKVASWRVEEIDHKNVTITLTPYLYENTFKIDDVAVEKNKMLIAKDTLKFPYKDVETTINFYENDSSTEPLTTLKLKGSYKLEAPSVYDYVVNAWIVKNVDDYNSIIDLYPNQTDINQEYTLISKKLYSDTHDFNDLSIGMRFTSDVIINGAYEIFVDRYHNGSHKRYEFAELKDIREDAIWVINNLRYEKNNLTVFLELETVTNPQYKDYHAGFEKGTKLNPWKVGATEADEVYAYLDGSTLNFVGKGRMQNFAEAERPWSGRTAFINSFNISEGITNVGTYALASTKISNVNLPSTITEIGDGAFSVCTNIKDITIPRSVKKIGLYAFYNCGTISHLFLERELERVRYSAFDNDNVLELTYRGTSEEFNNIIIEVSNDTLLNCKKIFLNQAYYNVKYELYGNAKAIESIELEKGMKIPQPSDPVPTIDGIFEGWYEDPNFTTKFDFSKPITKDTTVYAHFRKYIHEINIEVPAIIDGIKAPKKFNVSTDLEGMFNGLTKSAYDVEIIKENDRPLSYWKLLGKFEKGETYLIKNLAIIVDNNHLFADDLVINCNQETMTIEGISKGSVNLSFRFVAKNKVATTETEFYEVGDGENALYLEDEKEHTYALTIIDYINYNETELENINLSKEHQTKSKNAVSDYTNLSLLSLYDIKLVDDEGNKVEDGPIGIRIKLNNSKKNYKNFKLLYINEDYMIEEEPITLKIEDNYLVGTLPHLSNYALVAEKNETNPKTGDNLYLWITLTSISAITAIGLIYKLKREN